MCATGRRLPQIQDVNLQRNFLSPSQNGFGKGGLLCCDQRGDPICESYKNMSDNKTFNQMC
jgi:hypothetical protein